MANTQPSELQFMPPPQLQTAPYIQYPGRGLAAAHTATRAQFATRPTAEAAAVAAAAAAAFPQSLCMSSFLIPTASLSGKGTGMGR